MINWRMTSDQIVSKGLTTDKAGSLAGLHARRAKTESQYFTPSWVAAGIWHMLSQQALPYDELSVIDSSVGNGRLIEHAPAEAFIAGLDVDGRCIEALCSDAKVAGRHYQFEQAGLEDVSYTGFAVAVINPPFSIQINSPLLEPFDCTHFGVYGANTTAKSHEYALEQALSGAELVVALLPASMGENLARHPRLVAVVHLPDDTFLEEGANVSTAVFVFSRCKTKAPMLRLDVARGDIWPILPNMMPRQTLQPKLKLRAYDVEEPVITAEVTGDTTVELHKRRQRIVPKFKCGLTEARVMDAILKRTLRKPDIKHRYPSGLKYKGETNLFLDLHFVQVDPQGSIKELLSTIKAAGGEPILTPSLKGYIKSRLKKLERAKVPFEHWIKTSKVSLVMTAKRMAILDPTDPNTILKCGDKVSGEPKDGTYLINLAGRTFEMPRDKATALFDFKDERTGTVDWVCVAAGKRAAFPAIEASYRKKAHDMGIDWLWAPQLDAAIEQAIHPFGMIAAWQQGSGKARDAIALCLLHGGKNLVVIESALVLEMKRELAKIGLDPNLYQFIEEVKDTVELKKVNFITYNKLKSATRTSRVQDVIKGKRANQRYSHLLRNRINVMACDEGSKLANDRSLQSRALDHVLARKTVILDGTPMRSYPRDILNQLQATSGVGAHQPYSRKNGIFIELSSLKGGDYAERAVAVFQRNFVSYDWVTSMFQEDMKEGAKREIPLIKDVRGYRKLLAPSVQRILRSEPRMRDYCYSSETVYNKPIEPKWDRGHLEFYLRTATRFADWYLERRECNDGSKKGLSLTAVLAKIGAVEQAANSPFRRIGDWPEIYSPVTSKERAAVALCRQYVGQEKKVILFAKYPATILRLHKLLKDAGVSSLPFTGEMEIKHRTELLDREFRYGACSVLLSTWVGQRGLNIPQASRGIVFHRNWLGEVERQGLERMCRPEQTDMVTGDFIHLPGSLDVYQGQVVEWKLAAADAGLDWGNAATTSDEFVHLDSILYKFCKDTMGMSVTEMMDLKMAA